jgi:hypothetical protein
MIKKETIHFYKLISGKKNRSRAPIQKDTKEKKNYIVEIINNFSGFF